MAWGRLLGQWGENDQGGYVNLDQSVGFLVIPTEGNKYGIVAHGSNGVTYQMEGTWADAVSAQGAIQSMLSALGTTAIDLSAP